jgi:hypothetical protein
MPVFLCSQCKMMENTAVSNYWTRKEGSPALCTACDPEVKKWHGIFDPKPLPPDHIVGPDGFVYRKQDPILLSLRGPYRSGVEGAENRT